MHSGNGDIQCSLDFRRPVRCIRYVICALRPSYLINISLLLMLSSTGYGEDYLSFHEYTFSFNYNENYVYQWNATAGAYSENEKNTFTWTAPEVNTPTKVVISVQVSDKGCSCKASDSIEIQVIPKKETEQKADVRSNSMNSSLINVNAGLAPALPQNNSENTTALIPLEDASKPNAIYQDLDNVSAIENVTSENRTEPLLHELIQNETAAASRINTSEDSLNQDTVAVGQEESALQDNPSDPNMNQEPALSDTDNASSVETSDQIPVPSEGGNLKEEEIDLINSVEIPAAVEAESKFADPTTPSDQAPVLSQDVEDRSEIIVASSDPPEDPSSIGDEKTALKQDDHDPMICTLSFDDGTQVDIIFVEPNSFNDETYVILRETGEESLEGFIRASDPNNETLISNTTARLNSITPESNANQTDIRINQTEIAENMAEVAMGQPEQSIAPSDSSPTNGNAQADLSQAENNSQPEPPQANGVVPAVMLKASEGSEGQLNDATVSDDLSSAPAAIPDAASNPSPTSGDAQEDLSQAKDDAQPEPSQASDLTQADVPQASEGAEEKPNAAACSGEGPCLGCDTVHHFESAREYRILSGADDQPERSRGNPGLTGM